MKNKRRNSGEPNKLVWAENTQGFEEVSEEVFRKKDKMEEPPGISLEELSKYYKHYVLVDKDLYEKHSFLSGFCSRDSFGNETYYLKLLK